MTLKRKILAGLAGLLAAGLTLTACGTDTGNGDGDGGGGGSAAGQQVVTFWSWNPDATSGQPYIEAFEKAHPDIKIEHRFIQYSDYVNTTQLALQSGSGPDVFGLQVGALTNQFAPLAADLTPALEEKFGADWADKLISVKQLSVGDQQVAVPWMVTGGGIMWANQTMVDDLGLTVPTNRAELKDFCAAVKAAGKICMVQGAKDSWQNVDVYQTLINQIAPGEFYKALDGEADFSGDAFVQAFATWKSLFDDGIFQDGALGMTAYPDANDAFKKSEAAMIAFGTWQNSDTTKSRLASYTETYGEGFNPETVFMPYAFPLMEDGGTSGLMFGGPDVGFAVAAGSKVSDAATTFALWLTGSEEAQKMMSVTVQQPALASVPLDLSDVVTPEQVKALEAQGPALADMIGPREIQNADVRTALGDALSAVASGQQSPEDAAASVQAAIAAAK
ncbi:ABC transporter substrate-binding protein [Tessaracoccus defluvii]|uniref:ABC transporter substrate-binding protein n=1 Tax=Tessaracoccus defluvii TaxID=1285901 RepID=UPI0031DC4D2C